MIKEEILEMEAGREIDALVADKPYKCRKCGGNEFKFYGKDRRRCCLECSRKQSRQWALDNRERIAELRKTKPITESFKKYRRKWALENRYGMTISDYNMLWEKQRETCAICRGHPTAKRRLTVDHCHQTGKIRGLLCDSCNIGLAKFKDDPLLVQIAYEYLTTN